jgi:RNA polymerase sigma-B factor
MSAVITETLPARRPERRRSSRPAEQVRAEQTSALLLQAAATANLIGKERLLTQAVVLNLPIAARLAKRYTGRGIPTQDLVQVARLGLIKAVHRFDPHAGFDFRSYAVPAITGELKRHFRDYGWAVRPPRRIQDLQSRISTATSELAQMLGGTPTPRELANYLDVDEANLVEALAAEGCFTPTSLDRTFPNETAGGSTWGDQLGHSDPEFARVDALLTLAPIFRRLSERDRQVLRMRFVDDLTQIDIGRQIGVSQVQVSRILASILRQVRNELAG